MAFNNDKCKVMMLNSPRKDIKFMLGEAILEIITKYKYLGVVLSNKRLTSLYTHHFKLVIERAEKRLNCIRHFGLIAMVFDQHPALPCIKFCSDRF